MANSLGIYFGTSLIALIEVKGKKIIKQINIPRALISGKDLEEKVPEEVKIVAFLKEELRRNKIEAKEAIMSLSGQDMIIRTFETPVLPAGELASVVNFEVKKYIPFKTEDLVSDFQVKFDRANRKNNVLYTGIKKESLNKYLAVVEQLGLKLINIEYGGFSLLRFMRLTNLMQKGIVGVLSMDFSEDEEINFTVVEDGFPLFSRDITLSSVSEDLTRKTEMSMPQIIEKLKTEIRISLDYYNRKFQSRKIQKMLFLCNDEQRHDLELLLKEMLVPAVFVDSHRYIGKARHYSLSFIKCYGTAIMKCIKDNIKVNIISAKSKAFTQKEREIEDQLDFGAFFSDFQVDPKFIAIGVLACLGIWGLGQYQQFPVRHDLDTVISLRPQLPSVGPSATLQSLVDMEQESKNKINALHKAVMQQLYLTDTLDVLPRLIPDDIMLTRINYRKGENSTEVNIDGIVFLGDSDKERKEVNAFLAALKQDPSLSRVFKEMSITYIDHATMEKAEVTKFNLLLKG
ncbi:MAG: pilus assembly protein PilM [Candidatus Omnitrophica bacterium]|jgi:hypothetical protein|nr:pilus assembly protein PilM [Candidatus Omnitrophota bacterium]